MPNNETDKQKFGDNDEPRKNIDFSMFEGFEGKVEHVEHTQSMNDVTSDYNRSNEDDVENIIGIPSLFQHDDLTELHNDCTEIAVSIFTTLALHIARFACDKIIQDKNSVDIDTLLLRYVECTRQQYNQVIMGAIIETLLLNSVLMCKNITRIEGKDNFIKKYGSISSIPDALKNDEDMYMNALTVTVGGVVALNTLRNILIEHSIAELCELFVQEQKNRKVSGILSTIKRLILEFFV